MPSSTNDTPSSILIVGSGVFGLSTAYAFAQRPDLKNTHITVIDRAEFPASDGSSIDSSRIIRPDYPDPAYAQLMAEGQKIWRGEFGADGRYTESGLCIVMEDTVDPAASYWVTQAMGTLTKTLGLKAGPRAAGGQVTPFDDEAGSRAAMGTTKGFVGKRGYVNWTAGWAHAERAMRHLQELAEATGRIEFVTAEATGLLFSEDRTRVLGVELADGGGGGDGGGGDKSPRVLTASLTILATGAWTPGFLDLRGIASATGQALAYVDLTEEEQARLSQNPVILCETNGFFIIPPTERKLKVARHGYGYANPVQIPHPERRMGGNREPNGTADEKKVGKEGGEELTVSLPRTKRDDPDLDIAPEGLAACRDFLARCVPELAERPWTHTRICWYTDTPKGDFLIDWHPEYAGLFVATGGSGHAYKFLPVIGERIADLVQGRERDELGAELKQRWRWPTEKFGEDHVWTTDWRGGKKGMVLDEELAKK